MRISSFSVLALALVVAGCTEPASAPGSDALDPAAQVIRDAIEVHGGDRFDRVQVEFDFRGDPFTVLYDRGRFRFERRRVDAEGRTVVDRIDNEGASRQVNGAPVQLTAEERATLETQVNSVVYFAFLPYRLEDPAVRLRDLGDAELEDRPYRMIEVTFEQEGGGRDFDDRFVYWVHKDDHTLDFLAYRFHVGEGGTRFRRAVNRREVGGILVQDYENWTLDPEVDDVAAYGDAFAAGRLRLVSLVELENVRVSTP
jgi:hypothetical protein